MASAAMGNLWQAPWPDFDNKLNERLPLPGAESSGGGGAEIATCTMRFMDEYNGQTPPSDVAHGELYGGCHYLQYKDGVLSLVSSEDYWGASDFDITLENVVCGSHVVFGWTFFEGDYGVISFEGAGSDMETLLSDPDRAMNETTMFKAPSEPNAVCIVKFRGETDSWIGA